MEAIAIDAPIGRVIDRRALIPSFVIRVSCSSAYPLSPDAPPGRPRARVSPRLQSDSVVFSAVECSYETCHYGLDSASSSAGQGRQAADENSEYESPDQSANSAAHRGQADYV